MAKICVAIEQNHNGDPKILLEAVHAAAENGADWVKTQIVFSEDLIHRERFDQGWIEENGVVKTIKRPFEQEFQRMKGLDLKERDYADFVEECNKLDVSPILTVFSRRRIPFAASLPWQKGKKMIKIASYDCSSFPMIKELTDRFDFLSVSTGATSDEDIVKTAGILNVGKKPFAFLHCVTAYPNTLSMCDLARMSWLRQFTPLVGWSDHTRISDSGIKAAKVALMLGADIIERHFTILPPDKTKDGPVSLTPGLLKELSDFSKLDNNEQQRRVKEEIIGWQRIQGFPDRMMTHAEKLNEDYYKGRFASQVNGEWVYNWEDKPVF